MTSFSLLKEFSANKLKELRERNNLTQEELAEELTKRKLKREEELYKNKKIDKIDNTPITRQTVSKYENATIGMNQDILFDVASIFRKSINDFFPSSYDNQNINRNDMNSFVKENTISDEELQKRLKQFEENEGIQVLIDNVADMSEKGLNQVLNYAKFLKEQDEKDEQGKT